MITLLLSSSQSAFIIGEKEDEKGNLYMIFCFQAIYDLLRNPSINHIIPNSIYFRLMMSNF